jgi:SNF2 family DNA or RNA helicase
MSDKLISLKTISSNADEQFETNIAERMVRFKYLLETAQYQFKQYQYDGVKWCIKNELRHDPPGNSRGGFIADEMGLGKTIMMIGTMFVNYLSHTLIVVPPVLFQQWVKEIYRTSGHKALLFYGDNKKHITQDDINRSPIVITTYNMLLPENCILKNIRWNRVIFDEAHHLRNSETRRYRSCKQIKARVRWLVTGTPIQNKKKDFYNLCCAVGMKSSFYLDPHNLRVIGKHFVLRRTKNNVGINLPPLNKKDCIIEWKNQHEMMLSEEIHALLPNQTYVSSNKRRKLAEVFGKGGLLIAMLRARQSCIMPSLMRKNMELFCKLGLIQPESLEALRHSSKLDAVIQLILERKDNGKGKIIFCHYQSEIDTISKRLLEGGMQKVVTYDGRNSGGHNLATLAEPADALVIQIQTGCEGLNLQNNFSDIYFVSPHWNPCVEDQAIARCHRFGQTKPVDVFKFEMRGFTKENDTDEFNPITLEKYINNVQHIKRHISSQIFSEAKTTQ